MPTTRAAKPQERSRRPTNVTLPLGLVDEARRLGVNVSQACEARWQDRVAEARRQRAGWRRIRRLSTAITLALSGMG